MIQIRRITRDDPLYAQECRLRESILLEPIGYSMDRFQREFSGLEERFEHFVAVLDHPAGERVVGCACLLPDHPKPGRAKLMQMVVDPQRQGEGIGRRLVVAIESRAFGELDTEELFCHAQERATGFYSKLGWAFDSNHFLEAGIPHRRMTIRQPVTDPEPV